MKLTYFGAFQLEVNGQLITNFRTEKTAALLAYLVLEGQSPLPRTRIMDLLWHGYQRKAAQTSLRVALTHLRQMLGPTSPIKTTHKHIHFDGTDILLSSDVAALTEVANAQAEPFSAQQIMQRLALYRGEFLEGWEMVDSAPFQEWLQQRRAYYQNMIVNLRRRVTPLPSQTPRPYQHNLPRRPTPLFGHTTALAQLYTLLLDPRYPLITLIGEGGVGKTRLALAAASAILDTVPSDQPQPFSDGLWFVSLNDLLPTADLPDKLATAIGIACGISFTATAPLTVQLNNWLSTKSLLLILDSFEHLMAANTWLHSLIEVSPQSKILVTSRQRLNLQAAVVLPVYELAIPNTDHTLTVEQLLTYPSAQLFVERGQRVRPTFRLHTGNVADVAQICRQMAGLPLGIELAATLLLLYSPAQIAAQLRVNALTLRAEWLDWPVRHHSIEEVLTTSWRLLSTDETTLLARLAVIKGDFILEEAITIGDAQPATLFALVDKSLLRQLGDNDTRFTMHDLVRDYALRQLRQQPTLEMATYRRHAAYYLAMVAAEETALPNTRTAQTRLMSQLDNIRAAWAWSVAQGEVALWAKASRGLIWFYRMVGFSQEAFATLQTAANALRAYLAATPDAKQYQSLLACLLVGVAEFCPYAEREQLLQEALSWSERSQDTNSRSLAYYEMSTLARIRGDFQAMLAYAQQAHVWAQQSGQPQLQLFSLHSLAMAYYFQGDFTTVLTLADELKNKLKRTPNRDIESYMLTNLGHLYTSIENYGTALHSLRQAFFSCWHLKPPAINQVRMRLAKLYGEVGLFDTAQMLYHQSISYFEQSQDFYWHVLCQHGLGYNHYVIGNLPLALHHLNIAHQLTRQHTIPYIEHVVLIDLGYALTALGADQAATCFEQAIHLGKPRQRYSTISRAYIGLAKLALQANDKEQAQRAMDEAVRQWHKGRTDRADPRRYYWHGYEVLRALGDPRAQTFLQEGYTHLMQAANTLNDPLLQHSFLTAVPFNCALLTAARFNEYGIDFQGQ